MMGYFSVSKNAVPFRSLSRKELPVSMLGDLMIAVTEDLVRSASSYMMVPLKAENLPSTSVTPMSVTEKPTLECSASTENFSAAMAELASKHVTLAASRNRRNGWLRKDSFIGVPRAPHDDKGLECRLWARHFRASGFGMNG